MASNEQPAVHFKASHNTECRVGEAVEAGLDDACHTPGHSAASIDADDHVDAVDLKNRLCDIETDCRDSLQENSGLHALSLMDRTLIIV
jgi:hypothetical protein